MIIYILGQPWEFVITDNLTDFGECNVDARRILIRSTQSREQLIETSIHERAHAGWHITELNSRAKRNAEETIVTRLSAGLASVLDKRNKELLEALRD